MMDFAAPIALIELTGMFWGVAIIRAATSNNSSLLIVILLWRFSPHSGSMLDVAHRNGLLLKNVFARRCGVREKSCRDLQLLRGGVPRNQAIYGRFEHNIIFVLVSLFRLFVISRMFFWCSVQTIRHPGVRNVFC